MLKYWKQAYIHYLDKEFDGKDTLTEAQIGKGQEVLEQIKAALNGEGPAFSLLN